MKDKGFDGSGAAGWGKPPVFCGFSDEQPPNPLSWSICIYLFR
jgi:hypothetical protein